METKVFGKRVKGSAANLMWRRVRNSLDTALGFVLGVLAAFFLFMALMVAMVALSSDRLDRCPRPGHPCAGVIERP